MGFFQKILGLNKKKKVLGLALGSGGAKGMALLGVLKVFEEENIKFNVIAGTSIGSIIGGMYAAGYDSGEMMRLMKEYDLTNIKTLIILKLKGLPIEQLLDNILGGRRFEDLKLPFYAVASDLDSGKIVVMGEGNLANAMAASSAIPPVFKPVERDGKRLIDGALLNSVPADVCREHGADVVISVALSDDQMNTANKEVIDQMYRGHGIQLCNRLEKGIKNSDYMILPDLNEFGGASINGLEEMYSRGYEAAKKALPEIKAILVNKKIISKKFNKKNKY